jgi:hypothetical protein
MAEAKQKSEWDRMSLLCALTANCHSAGKQFTTDDFSPFAKSNKNAVIKDQSMAMAALKRMATTSKQINLPKGS